MAWPDKIRLIHIGIVHKQNPCVPSLIWTDKREGSCCQGLKMTVIYFHFSIQIGKTASSGMKKIRFPSADSWL